MVVSWSAERGSCRRYTLAEIEKATDSFNPKNKIGRGGEGDVYKGVVSDGSLKSSIAVKRLKRSSLGEREIESFENEIHMLSRIHHANLVSLIGYCYESNELILVYEFMTNGNLRHQLKSSASPLSYQQRVLICIGAARGIDYLHSGTSLETNIIHRDVKPENILLNEKMEAKVSDFGLSRIVPANPAHSYVITGLRGTFGYIAPEYITTRKYTKGVDVYAFGVVLVDVLCKDRRLLYGEDSNHKYMVVDDSFRKRVLCHLDPVLEGTISQSSLEAFMHTAEKCLIKDPYQRPTMNQVVVMLESALKLQKQPVYSENRSNKTPCDIISGTTAKFEKISLDQSSSVNFDKTKKSFISGTILKESDAVENTADVTKPSQESQSALLSENRIQKDIASNRGSSMTHPRRRNLPGIRGIERKIVLYSSMKTQTDCNLIRVHLNVYHVTIEERNPTTDERYEAELRRFFSKTGRQYILPQLFIGGENVGGFAEVDQLYRSGDLMKILLKRKFLVCPSA